MTTFKDTTSVINIRELQFLAAAAMQKYGFMFWIEVLVGLIDVEAVVFG